MKWYKRISRTKGLPGLDAKIREFKLDYLDAKQSQGGFLREGELLFLEAIRKDPAAWDLAKVRDQVFGQLWRTIWHEDDDHEDRGTLPLFSIAGVDVEPTLTFPDAGTPGNMRKTLCRWATARQATLRADMIEQKADQSYEKARRVREIAETALIRGGGNPTTLLYDVRDGLAPPPPPTPSPFVAP